MCAKPKLQVQNKKGTSIFSSQLMPLLDCFRPTPALELLAPARCSPVLHPQWPPQYSVWVCVGVLHSWYSGALLLTLYLHEKHIEQQPFPVCRVSMNQISYGAAATELNSIWHCVRIYYGIKRAKLSCCFISNPVTLCAWRSLSFPLAQAHLSPWRYHTHTHTHSPRPKTWNFYTEQDTWELEKSHGATSINPPRLLLFSKSWPGSQGPGWVTSCPR